MKDTVLNRVHFSKGAQMGDFQGWKLPLQFSDCADEHHAVRTAAGLFDVGFLGRIELAGADAESLLQSLFTRDVAALPDGTAVYGLFLNDQGGILDASLLLRLPLAKSGARFLITTNAAATDGILSLLRTSSGKDVKIVDRTAELAQIALQGPHAELVLERCSGPRRRKIRQKQVREIELCGIKTVLSRTGYTGERGYEIIVPAERAEETWNCLLDAGRELGVLACGMTCRDILRMEAGYVQYGAEIGESRTPLEARLMMVVDLHKDFRGKEAVEKLKAAKPEKLLVGFELFDKGLPKSGATIFSENREIGFVTSSTHSYHRRHDIGLGYVVNRYALSGQEIEVEVKDREIAAKVVDLPFYKRK